jgi:DNA-binding NarL/FixJ family response regulator
MKKIRTLIVDDHKVVRDGLKYILNSDKKIEVVYEASNGIEAIQYLEKDNNIDVVLMDISMPKLNGIEATELIKKLYKNINILALTMHNEESYILNMIKSGASGYVLKDSDSSNILDAINSIANGKNYYSNDVASIIVKHMMNPENSNQKKSLSDREIEIIKLVAKGNTNNKIGDNINISPRTVETHRRNIIKKLKLKNTAELINYAYKNNIIE